MFKPQRHALIVASALCLLALSTVAGAQTLSTSGLAPVDLGGFTLEQRSSATQLLEAHQLRIEIYRSMGELSREQFDRLFDDLVNDLDRVVSTGVVANKAANPCSQACKAAQTGKLNICNAATQAVVAVAACPTSTYAQTAEIFASSVCSVSGQASETYACMGPSGQTQALSELTSAKQGSREAWNNAAYAYTIDNCSESFQTAVDASNAYFSFHDAKTFMASCN